MAHAKVTGKYNCRCATVDIAVSHLAPPSSQQYKVVPVDVNVVGEDGEHEGGIILFMKDGYLSSLEIYSVGQEPIATFPPIERLEFVLPSGNGIVQRLPTSLLASEAGTPL